MTSTQLTFVMMTQGVRNMGFINATQAECDEVFAWLDNDSSGVIPYKELDRKLRERPAETKAEKLAREAEERAAAERAEAEAKAAVERAAAEEAARLAAEKAAAEAAAAEAKAAARAAKAAAKVVAKQKSETERKPKQEFLALAPSTERKPPQPKFTGFKGNERFVQPTLAAHGARLLPPLPLGTIPDFRALSSSPSSSSSAFLHLSLSLLLSLSFTHT